MDLASIVNVKLLAHPLNWLIVFAVILMAGMALSLARREYGETGETAGGSPD